MHMAELSNAQSQALYSHLGPVYSRSPHPRRKAPGEAPQSAAPTGVIYDPRAHTLLVSKCICVTSSVPLVATFERLLRALLTVATGNGGRAHLSLESYVYNMLYEVPLPPPGRSMRLCTATETIVCQRPGQWAEGTPHAQPAHT